MNKSIKYPKFAVVGHPNKGKSSIVSTLAFDSSVQIGDTPGTTQVKRSFPLKVDNKIVYELFDTPGFQRARQILAWLEEHKPTSANKRVDVVKTFISKHRDNPKFRDEIELLEPILEGAGIIYVVDASKPYGAEYEIEMEILRWCGQPSMAILNLIGDEDYRDDWTRALGQYFRLVRTFNPIKAKFSDHISLLESMAQLNEEWTDSIKSAIAILENLHKQKIEQTIDVIVDYIIKSLSYVYTQKIKGQEATEQEKSKAKERYKAKLTRNEKKLEKDIESIWQHLGIEKEKKELALDTIGLFSKQSASIFGLTQKELIITGASAGAIGGLGIDLAFGGGTMFLASLIGGAVGGVGAVVGFDNLYEVKVLGRKIGKRELTIGPMQNINFPYILLGRAIYYAQAISNRSHAIRDTLKMDNDFQLENIFDSESRKELEKVHNKLRSKEKLSDDMIKEYRKVILDKYLAYN
jgi:GTPase Era involved in 16S rRNA processing